MGVFVECILVFLSMAGSGLGGTFGWRIDVINVKGGGGGAMAWPPCYC